MSFYELSSIHLEEALNPRDQDILVQASGIQLPGLFDQLHDLAIELGQEFYQRVNGLREIRSWTPALSSHSMVPGLGRRYRSTVFWRSAMRNPFLEVTQYLEAAVFGFDGGRPGLHGFMWGWGPAEEDSEVELSHAIFDIDLGADITPEGFLEVWGVPLDFTMFRVHCLEHVRALNPDGPLMAANELRVYA